MHHHEVRANDASSRTGRWTRPPLIQEIRASMLEASTIGTGNSGIDAGRAHHRYRKFGHRYWTRPPSMQEIWASMLDTSTIDAGNSGIDPEPCARVRRPNRGPGWEVRGSGVLIYYILQHL